MESWVISEGSSTSDWIAFGALVVAIASFVATIILNRRQERRGYMDEYWFRVIFAPSCVDPVIAFRAKWEAELTALASTPIDDATGTDLADRVSVDAADLLQKVWIAKLFDGGFYDFCEHELETFEDTFVSTLGAVHLRPKTGKRSPPSVLIDHVTSTCARVLQRAAELHGDGLKIAPHKTGS